MKILTDFRETVETGMDPRLREALKIHSIACEKYVNWNVKGRLTYLCS